MSEDRGSVLLLMPAAALIFLVLAAIAVDFAGAYASQRQLRHAAAGAAGDAATAAIDLPHLYETGEVRLLPWRARDVVERSLADRRLDRLGLRLDDVDVAGRTVTVRVSGRAPYVIAKALPGGPDGVDLSASSTATAEQ